MLHNLLALRLQVSKRGYADLPRNFTTAEANLPKTTMNDRSALLVFDHKINNHWKFTAQASYLNYQQVGASLWPSGFSQSKRAVRITVSPTTQANPDPTVNTYVDFTGTGTSYRLISSVVVPSPAPG